VLLDGLRKYQDVVQVYYHDAFRDEVTEYIIHHGLEGGRTVCETEEHDQRLEEFAISTESGFPFVSVLHTDIVKTPTDVQLGKVLCTTELLRYQLGDQWKWILVFDRDCVEGSIVLDETEGAVFLFDKEDGRSHG
jgi:hypothetical protein